MRSSSVILAPSFLPLGLPTSTVRAADSGAGFSDAGKITASVNLAGVTNMATLVTAINTQAGTQVNATMVNVGSSTSPDYRLSMQGTQLGDLPIQLNDGSMNLETQQVQGGLASYQVNGSSTVAQN